MFNFRNIEPAPRQNLAALRALVDQEDTASAPQKVGTLFRTCNFKALDGKTAYGVQCLTDGKWPLLLNKDGTVMTFETEAMRNNWIKARLQEFGATFDTFEGRYSVFN